MIRRSQNLLAVVAPLLLVACRGREPAGGLERDAAILTARTLGLAYLRSQQFAQAETAFAKIVALASDQALGYANLGLVHLRLGRYDVAEREIRRAAALDTASDDIALTLAKVYELTGRTPEARREVDRVLRRTPDDLRALYELTVLEPASKEAYLRRIVARAPGNVAARLELVDVLLARGAADSAATHLEALERQLPQLPREATRFFRQALVLAQSGRAAAAAAPATTFHRFMETTAPYQASLDKLRGASGVSPGYPILTFNPIITPPAQDARTIAAAIRFSDVTGAVGLGGVPPRADTAGDVALATGDYDGDGGEDVFVAGQLFHNELAHAAETTGRAGIQLRDRAVAATFGDYDNDGRPDLYVATASGGILFRNAGDSTFTDVTVAAGLGGAPPATTALFVDLDHDGDLDLFLATPAGNRVYRNTLDGRFQDMTGPMGLGGGGAGGTRDAAFGDLDGDGHVDLVVVGNDGRLTLFRNAGQGRFEDATRASGLAQAAQPGYAAAVAVGDYDNDGFLDLFVAAPGGTAPVLYRNRGDGTFESDRRSTALAALRTLAARAAVFFDFDNDGFLDLVVVGEPTRAGARGVYLLRNDQTGRFVDQSSILPTDLRGASRVAAVDYDRDGDLDLIVVAEDGRPRLLLNDGGNANQYVKVELAALRTGSGKNNRFGIGSTLELRAGKLYEARVVTSPVTHFGLGQRLKADVLRVRWPNGVAQTVYYPGTDADILEQQILKGSCPFLYAWDGTAFQFVTDVMWRSALGMPLGIMTSGGIDIAAAPSHASREYMRIPGRALASKNGRYVLQLTEELWETAYLDQAKLVAVDHPDSVDVYVDEGFVPPAPGPAALRLYAVAHPRPPVAATDEHGTDWLPALRARDDRYVAPLTLTRYQGLATLHDLILDLGDLKGLASDSVYLFLAGWIYPTDASINIALAQSGKPGVIFPYLEVKDREGGWRRAADVPFPSGKNKTVIVDLTGKFLSADHRVRIRTNMEIYWDQAFVAAAGSPSASAITPLDPVTADLHYRGFSRLYRKGGRYGPDWAAYEDRSRESPWEPITGRFTRYGDVLPLVRAPDDMYVIMAPGDETTLTFDASTAPPLPPGWTRDFLLYTDAWLKDSDRNTAAGGTVAPLPFHGMSRYPYGSDEAYPKDAAHERYLDVYNTRRVERYRPVRESATSSNR